MRPADIRLIADDYGLAPGVSEAIRILLGNGQIDGTGCMTLFPEWSDEALSILALAKPEKAEIGIHLTLTDFKPVSGRSVIRGESRLPNLGRLLSATYRGSIDREGLEAELDLQLTRFIDAIGRVPDFIDGHQHVHFLPPVRRWLETRIERLKQNGKLPWLRGQPSLRGAPDWKIAAKTATVAIVAQGFNARMTRAGYPVRGPLGGFYDWTKRADFLALLQHFARNFPAGAVVMCHPGKVDNVLVERDVLTDARQVEFEALQRFRPVSN